MKCSKAVSKKETKCLDLFQIKKENRNICLPGLGKINIDGYDPDTNFCIEFNGSFYHGDNRVYNHNEINHLNKMTFGELYQKTINKANKIILSGYNLISVWEKDYDDFILNHHSPNNYLEIEIRLAKGLKNI